MNVKKGYLFLVVLILLSLGLVACTEGPKLPPELTGQIAPTATATSEQPAPIPTISPPVTELGGVTPVIAPTATANALIALPPPTTADSGPVVTTAAPNPTRVGPAATTTAAQTTAARTATPAAGPTPTRTSQPQPTFTPVPTSVGQPYNGPLSEVVRGRTGKKQVAITLDAGAGAAPFPKMLSALSGAGVKITFFLTGQWAQQNPNYVQQIVANGHEIANHTWSHPDLTTVSDEQIKAEIEKTEEFLARFTGKTTKPLWRAPYGSRNAHVMQVVNRLGYRSIFWTIDSLDSVGQPKSAQFLIDRITKQTNAQLDGEVILMHIGSATTADALPAILQNLKERGFQVVTVSELLR